MGYFTFDNIADMIDEYYEKLTETGKLRQELAAVSYNLKLTEAQLFLLWINNGEINGKNEAIREAQLRVLLNENKAYLDLLERKEKIALQISNNEAWISAYTAALDLFNEKKK